MKIFDKLYFIGPHGLGDCFVYAGMTNYFADKCQELHYPALPHYYETLKTLFSHHPNIKVVKIANIEEEDRYCKEHGLSKLLRTPLYGKDPTFPLWDLQMYSNFDVPYHHRYTNFRLPELTDNAIKLYEDLGNGEPYILLHRFSSHQPGGYGFNIEEFRSAYNLPDIKIIEVKEGITDNMMDYVKLIMEASEIHCVASSFFALVDSMVDKTRADLYLHDLRNTAQMRFNSDYNGHRWKIVQY